MSKKNIVAIGSVAFDSVKTPLGAKERILGGSVTHFVNAASLMPALSIGIVGVVGEDFSAEHENFFKTRKIDLSDLQKKAGKTFFWEGYYENDMNQAHTVKTELNVFADFKPAVSAANKETDILFLGNIDPVLQSNVLNDVKFTLSFMDTMNYWLETKRDDVQKVLNKIDGIIINEGEAAILTGEKNYVKAAKKVLAMGPKYIILKRGNAGVTFFTRNNSFFSFPAFPVDNVVDPTGAGDSFAGGFVSYLANRLKKNKNFKEELFKEALVYATLVASCNVQGFGVDGIKDRSFKDISLLYKQYQQYSSLPKLS